MFRAFFCMCGRSEKYLLKRSNPHERNLPLLLSARGPDSQKDLFGFKRNIENHGAVARGREPRDAPLAAEQVEK